MGQKEAGTPLTHEAMAVSLSIQPLLKGRDPGVQGAVLADLVSVYFAGHHPALRERMMTLWIDTVRKMIPQSEKEIFTRQPRPPGWDEK